MVGLFVVLATLLLLTGFCYYFYHTAQRKGWFKLKLSYYTELYSAAGLKVGDPVRLMGFDVGEISRIDTLDPSEIFNVYVEFTINEPYYGYLWTRGTYARVSAADFLGKRSLEVTKGYNYMPTYLFWEGTEWSVANAMALSDLTNRHFLNNVYATNSGNKVLVAGSLRQANPQALQEVQAAGVEKVELVNKAFTRPVPTYAYDFLGEVYRPYRGKKDLCRLPPEESPALTEQLQSLVTNAQAALPGVFAMTNQIGALLSNLVSVTANADVLLVQSRPILANAAVISENLKNPQGSLGDWILPTNLNREFLIALTNANGTLTNASATLAAANTNLIQVVAQLQQPMQSLSAVMSNLNTQVQSNTNLVTAVYDLLVHTDQLVEGFKRHWFMRGAFKQKPTNSSPASVKGKKN